jgi:glutaredoxin
MTDIWFTIYTTSAFECPWCIKLKELLNVYGYDFYEKDIIEENNRKTFIEAGFKKVPQVYLSTGGDTRHIGGYETTKDYLRRNFFENHPKREQILKELEELE